MIEFNAVTVTAGEAEFVKVPTDSGNSHWVARCPACRTAMWNEHGARQSAVTALRASKTTGATSRRATE
jgi:hypothetical protein